MFFEKKTQYQFQAIQLSLFERRSKSFENRSKSFERRSKLFERRSKSIDRRSNFLRRRIDVSNKLKILRTRICELKRMISIQFSHLLVY